MPKVYHKNAAQLTLCTTTTSSTDIVVINAEIVSAAVKIDRIMSLSLNEYVSGGGAPASSVNDGTRTHHIRSFVVVTLQMHFSSILQAHFHLSSVIKIDWPLPRAIGTRCVYIRHTGGQIACCAHRFCAQTPMKSGTIGKKNEKAKKENNQENEFRSRFHFDRFHLASIYVASFIRFLNFVFVSIKFVIALFQI